MQAESYTSMKFISPANDTAGTGSGGTMATFNPGSSASYYINVISTATFILNIRVADGNGGGVLQIRNSSSLVMKSFTTPATGSLNSLKTISDTFKLSAGKYIIRIYDLSGKYNVDWLEIVNVPSPVVPVTPEILTKGYVDSNYVSKVYLDSVIRAIVKTWFFDATYFKGNPLDSLNPFSLQIGEDTGSVVVDTATGFINWPRKLKTGTYTSGYVPVYYGPVMYDPVCNCLVNATNYTMIKPQDYTRKTQDLSKEPAKHEE